MPYPEDNNVIAEEESSNDDEGSKRYGIVNRQSIKNKKQKEFMQKE